MKILNISPQMIVRDEDIVEKLSIDTKYVIYSGLGHVVLDVNNLKENNKDLFNEIKREATDNYFFRISTMMDVEEDENVLYRILAENLYDFKPKILSETQHCYLGMDSYIVKLEKLSKSKNFQKVNQYHCTINRMTIDSDGNISTEELWSKEKYGEVEKFLPKELEKFSPIIEFMRNKNFLSLRLSKLKNSCNK